MKVLYVLRYYPTLTETFIYREITELLTRGVEVEAVAMGSRADGQLADGLPPIVVHRPPSGLSGLLALMPVLWSLLSSPEYRVAGGWLRRFTGRKSTLRALWVARLVNRSSTSRLHVHFAGEAAEWGCAVSLATGVPVGVTVHAVDMFKPRLSFGRLVRIARPLVTISEANQRTLKSQWGVASILVRCGVALNDYTLTTPVPESPLRIIAVGRHVPKKGLDALVSVVRRLGDRVSLRLVSDYPGLESDPNIVVGALRPTEIADALANADVFCLPCRVASDGDRDGIPVAIMEAMAAGLPVITTAISGIPELVDESVGWLVPVDDTDALQAAIVVAEQSASERTRRGLAGRARLAERGFTVSAQVSALMSAWDD